jgi:hypothetical protein
VERIRSVEVFMRHPGTVGCPERNGARRRTIAAGWFLVDY